MKPDVVKKNPDHQRARRVLAQLGGIQNSLEQRLGVSRSPSLDRILGDVWEQRSVQSERLAAWLQGGQDGQGATQRETDTDVAAPQEASKKKEKKSKAKETTHVRVLQRRELTPDLLMFRLARPPTFTFSAGASVKIVLGGISRRYSIVSAPHEPFIELFVELIPQGRMSAQWQGVTEGAEIAMRSPKAGLSMDEGAQNHLMVATVTGINPFVGIMRDAVHRGRTAQRFLIIHGASFASEIGYSEELAAIAAANPQMLTYLPTVSRPETPENSGWTGARGRVGVHVETQLESAGWSPADTCIYACGNPAMVDDIERSCRARGFEVRTERYK